MKEEPKGAEKRQAILDLLEENPTIIQIMFMDIQMEDLKEILLRKMKFLEF